MIKAVNREKPGEKGALSDPRSAFRLSLGQRLEILLAEFDSRAEAAQVAAVNADQLGRYLRGDAKPPLEVIARLAVRKGYSLDWIANGTGQPRAEESKIDGEFALVPVWGVEASSGFGAFVDVEGYGERLAFSRMWLRTTHTTAEKNLCVVFNRGDSNEPDIRHGDAMLVDRGIERLQENAFYVFDRDGMLLVKGIERAIDGHVILRSRNPRYSDQTLRPDEATAITVFGRVIWRGGLL